MLLKALVCGLNLTSPGNFEIDENGCAFAYNHFEFVDEAECKLYADNEGRSDLETYLRRSGHPDAVVAEMVCYQEKPN